MPLRFGNRVLETVSAPGTAAFALAAAVTGFQRFNAVPSIAIGDTLEYFAEAVDANGVPTGLFECGLGTYSAANTLSRTAAAVVAGSSGAGVLVNFPGTTYVASGPIAPSTVVVTPAQITVDQNDYAPAGYNHLTEVLRVDADQIRRINGIAEGYDGRILAIHNIGGANSTLILPREAAGSAAANRFLLTRDLCIDATERAILQYDAVTARWREFSTEDRGRASARMTPFVETDFLGAAGAIAQEATSPWDFAVISAGTQSKIAGEPNRIGIHRITSSTTTNSGGYVMTDVTAIRIAGGEVAEFLFRIPDLTTLTVRMGFLDTLTSVDAVDGAYFEIAATGVAVGKTSSNSVRTTSATIASLVINTWYRARVEVNDAATSVTFTIFAANGNQLGQQINSANIPTTAGRECGHGFVATKSGTVAQACLDTDYMSLAFNRALER